MHATGASVQIVVRRTTRRLTWVCPRLGNYVSKYNPLSLYAMYMSNLWELTVKRDRQVSESRPHESRIHENPTRETCNEDQEKISLENPYERAQKTGSDTLEKKSLENLRGRAQETCKDNLEKNSLENPRGRVQETWTDNLEKTSLRSNLRTLTVNRDRQYTESRQHEHTAETWRSSMHDV